MVIFKTFKIYFLLPSLFLLAQALLSMILYGTPIGAIIFKKTGHTMGITPN